MSDSYFEFMTIANAAMQLLVWEGSGMKSVAMQYAYVGGGVWPCSVGGVGDGHNYVYH